MNRIISLFLFIFVASCLNAQYNTPIRNKVTLGKQTTADGLVWRGVLNDTALITPFSDTSAYIILDTINNRFYNYNRATNVWSLAGGGVSVTSFSAGTTGLTPSTATTGAVTLGGTLAVANGGTGQSTLAAAGIVTGTGTTNYLSKFTSSSTIGNSSIIDNSTLVEISNISFPELRLKRTNSVTNAGLISFVGSDNSLKWNLGTNFNIGGAGFEINYGYTNHLFLSQSGNLGLGVTPSAWNLFGLTAMQVKNAAFFGYLNNAYVGGNAYYDGGWKYIANGGAALYAQYTGTGEHQWLIANNLSGTAGNAITFTQAMTLNASGNLSIGNTNNTYKLDVNGTGRFTGKLTISNTSDAYAEMTTSAVDADALFGFSNTGDGNSSWGIGRRNTGEFWIANYTGNFLSGTRTVPFQIASTGAATFSSSVTSNGLFVNGTNLDFYVGQTYANTLNFGYNSNTVIGSWVNYSGYQGGTTQFRDFNIGNGKNGIVAFFNGSTGNVGIGTASPTNRLTVIASNTGTQVTTVPIGKFVNTGNEFSKFIIGSDNANYDAVFSMDNNATLANTKLRIYIGNGTNSTAGHSNDQIVLQGNGNVGIGTTSPARKLDVNGTGRYTSDLTISNSSRLFLSGTTGQDWALRTNASTANFEIVDWATVVARISMTTSGNVGIGTTTPNTAIDARASSSTAYSSSNLSAYVGAFISNSGTGGFANITLNTVDATQGSNCTTAISAVSESSGTRNSAMTFATREHSTGNIVERMRITSGGNVGIGTQTPAVQFHTTGGVRFATFAGGGTTTLSVDNTGDLARTSSIELKKDVVPINYGLNEILQIKPINFNWIDENKFGNENENGFIAEDVMSVIPNVVAADAHGLFMDYTKLIPILTKAIQEQQALIKALEQRIINLENK